MRSALGLSAEDARRVGALVPWVPVSQEAITIDHCTGGGMQGQGTPECHNPGGRTGQYGTAVGGAELDLSGGAVYWKATLTFVELSGYVYLGAIAAWRLQLQRSDGWSSYDGSVSIAGKETAKHGGWAAGTLKMGDVSVIKLEAEQLSVRVQRVGDRTFTVPTNGQRGLRVWVCLHTGGRVRLSAAEPHEEYCRMKYEHLNLRDRGYRHHLWSICRPSQASPTPHRWSLAIS